MSEVKIIKLDENAVIPTYAKYADAGADLAYCGESVTIQPGQRVLLGTGLSMAIPVGWVGLVHPRSGLASRHGVTVLNAPGTVDAGYRGEVKVNLINLGSDPITFNNGDRVAQIVFQKVKWPKFVLVDELDLTERGTDGHGSTGVGNG